MMHKNDHDGLAESDDDDEGDERKMWETNSVAAELAYPYFKHLGC